LDETQVFIAVLRESVSLFVLLVFLLLVYRVVDRLLSLFEDFAENLLDVLEKIAKNKKQP